MRANRSYRPALSAEQATAELRSCSGTQFDPAVVEALLELVEAGEIEPPARVSSFRHATLNRRSAAATAALAPSS